MGAIAAVIGAVVALGLGVAVGLAARNAIVSRRILTAEARAAKLVADAEREAEVRVRQALVEVKEEISGMRRGAEEDVRSRRDEIQRIEERLNKREAAVEARAASLDQEERRIRDTDQQLASLRIDLERASAEQRSELERVSRLTTQEAKEALIAQVVDSAKREAMGAVREIEQQAREEGERRARKIVTIAIQRVASEQTAESTVSVFSLPSDDLKGRIIGREGRNIRAF
jgi:ribonucrease Y